MSTNYICFSDAGLIRCLKGGQTYLNTLELALIVSNTPIANGFDNMIPGWTEASFSGYARGTFNFGNPATNANPPDAEHGLHPASVFCRRGRDPESDRLWVGGGGPCGRFVDFRFGHQPLAGNGAGRLWRSVSTHPTVHRLAVGDLSLSSRRRSVDDRTIRLAVLLLGTVACLSVGGVIVVEACGRAAPLSLSNLASGALCALAALASAKPPEGHRGPPAVPFSEDRSR